MIVRCLQDFRPAKSAPVLLLVGCLGWTHLRSESLALNNGLVSLDLSAGQAGALTGPLRDLGTGSDLAIGQGEPWIKLGSGPAVHLGELRQSHPPTLEAIDAVPTATRAADREGGQAIVDEFISPDERYAVRWRAELRHGARYLLVSLQVTNRGSAELPLEEAGLINQPLAGAAATGTFTGAPIVAGTRFLGLEHPLALNRVEDGQVRCVFPVTHALAPKETLEIKAVFGFTDPGQLRRGFLAYLERERPRPYHPFLHYNTWLSIGNYNHFTEQDVAGVIAAFDREMYARRGVALDGFVLDDGWDDPRTLWKFSSGFPHGLKPVSELAAKTGAAMGIWLSPWGGYEGPKLQRVTLGAAAGYETRDGSFSLAGPRYFERFRGECTRFVQDDHVVYFKFDGIGANVRSDSIDPEAARDFLALARMVDDLRLISPRLFVNETTGTWPSPFFLLNVDSIWRGGEDHQFMGTGTPRERWITYRDALTYRNVVHRSPLYPLNSLMVHGILYAAKAEKLESDPGDDFAREVWSYFGSGTQLQELYLSPELLSAHNWDDLAAAARWSRENTDTLRDTHWIGGDPSQAEVYGWAAWSNGNGTIVLRNPSGRPANYPLDLATAFELPAGAPRSYSVKTLFPAAAAPKSFSGPEAAGPQSALGISRSTSFMPAGAPISVALDPYEVLVLEAHPR